MSANYERLRAALEAHATSALRAELAERIEIWNEDDAARGDAIETAEIFEAVDAFLDLADLAESDPDWIVWRRLCRQILTAAGYYRPVSEAELACCVVSHGRAYAFKAGGVKFAEAGAIGEWIGR